MALLGIATNVIIEVHVDVTFKGVIRHVTAKHT